MYRGFVNDGGVRERGREGLEGRKGGKVDAYGYAG